MFMLCAMWNTSVFVEHMHALQEDSAVGWMTKESLINFWQGKFFFHLQSIQTSP
jgi:hypothetical protein